MSGIIFINYWRDDDPGFTQAIYNRLEAEFGADAVKMDVEGGIHAGENYVDKLLGLVAEADVILAIVGRDWLAMLDKADYQAPDKTQDWVRIELEAAFAQGKRIIPVIIGKANIPQPDDLPGPLKEFAYLNVLRVTNEGFKRDTQGLISELRHVLAQIAEERRAQSEAERKRREEARKKREAEDAARRAEAEQQAREQALAGLSAEQIEAARELANWEFIKDKGDIDELRNHLARFPQGDTARYASEKMEALVWAGLGAAPGIAALEEFVAEFPEGAHADQARARIKELKGGGVSRRRVLKAFAAVAAVTASGGGILYYLANKRLIGILTGHKGTVTSVAFSPDGRLALSGSDDKTLKLWEVATGKLIRTFTGHKSYVHSVAFSPDGRLTLSGSDDKTLKLWEVATGKEIRSFTGHKYAVTSVAFSPDGRLALSGSVDNTLKLWEVATGKLIRTLTRHKGWVTSVAFSPDGRLALSGSGDQTLKLWEVATGKEIRTLTGLRTLTGHTGHKYAVTSVAFSPDGRLAISGSHDRTLKLWEVATGKLIRTFTGHEWFVNSVAFSPDGRLALSGSGDQTLKLWEVATGREIRTFTGPRGWGDWVRSVAFSPDGRRALSGSSDNTLKLWDVSGF